MSLKDRFNNAWNAFRTEEKRREDLFERELDDYQEVVYPNYARQDRYRMRFGNERTLINSIYNRIANDVASITIQHVRVDENDRYLETISSGLNECITLSANIDQTARDFWLDLVLSMLDEGVVAAVPIDTSVDIVNHNSFDILSLRTGKITQWHPSTVKIEVYNDRRGSKEELTLPKDKVAIIENPFYSVMNEPNSTLRRLIHKLGLLDQIDNQKASSKLNLLIKLPYSLKSPTRKAQAEERRQVLEDQLEGSRYGVAYIDSTEQVTQLNRAIDNDLVSQIENLTKQLYAQLGIGEEVFMGTASQEQMLVYNNKVLEPILTVIKQEFTRKFLTPTARTQGQKITYYQDPFRLVPVGQLADIADKLTRNEVLSSNEVRATIGFKASDDPRSDQLINKNIPTEQIQPGVYDDYAYEEEPAYSPEEDPEVLEQIGELEALLDSDELTDDDLSETEILLKEIAEQLE